ncbi:MAG: hypothetical protein LBV60_20765 [Streptomyces sp.]|nr:hypothetical protein [Streptomyces sp.]
MAAQDHRRRTAARLFAVLASGLLPEEPADLARFHLAKAQREIGQDRQARDNLRDVAARGGRLAPGRHAGSRSSAGGSATSPPPSRPRGCSAGRAAATVSSATPGPTRAT